MRDHKAIGWATAWLFLECLPAIIPASVSDEAYGSIYLHSEDLATVALGFAFYYTVPFSRVVLKAFAVSCVTFALTLAVTNLGADYLALANPQQWAMSVVGLLVASAIIIMRFLRHGLLQHVEPGRIYKVVTRPRRAVDFVGLVWSGLGAGVYYHCDGQTWKFSAKTGTVITKLTESLPHTIGLVDCGKATGKKIDRLNAMVGQRWSARRNCFTIFRGLNE